MDPTIGRNLQRLRRLAGLTQEQLAERAGLSADAVRKLEQGQRDSPRVATLRRLADALDVDASALLAPPPVDPAALETSNGYAHDVDRRSFLGVVAGAGVASALPAVPVRVGLADVERLWADAYALYLADDRQGGAAVYRTVTEQLARVQALLDNASYSEVVGLKLQSLSGRLTEMAGRCAFDAGHKARGRQLLTEALMIARMADDDELAVSAFAWLSRDASAQGAGRQAVELSLAAQRTAGRPAGPRLRSVLSLREGLGHALRGDVSACTAALARSECALDGEGTEEPAWLGFMGPAVLHGGAAEAHLYLGQPEAAERFARNALDENDADAFPRNRGLYLGRLAEALVSQGSYDEGAAVTVEALGGVRSGRMVSQLKNLTPTLAAHQDVDGVPEALGALQLV